MTALLAPPIIETETETKVYGTPLPLEPRFGDEIKDRRPTFGDYAKKDGSWWVVSSDGDEIPAGATFYEPGDRLQSYIAPFLV